MLNQGLGDEVVVVRGEDREEGGGGMMVGMVMSGEVEGEGEGEECLLVTHQQHSPLNQIQSKSSQRVFLSHLSVLLSVCITATLQCVIVESQPFY